jgi:tetratricopeptide (TPR) repeat protein
LRRSPHDGEARLMLARVLAAKNDMLACAQQLHQVPDWWPKKHEALFREGQAAMVVGRAKQAEAAWKACVANDPLHPTPPKEFTESVKELISLYNLEQRREEARELLWWAYQQAEPTEHATILIMRVWVELLKNDPSETARKLRRFISAMPDDWEARRALARNEATLGNDREAAHQIDACLHALPGDVRIWRDWLAILAGQGDRDGLAAALAKLPPSAESDATIWRFRGMLREQSSDWQGAADAYRQTIRLQPFEEEAYYKLSIVEERLGESGLADEHRRRYQKLHDAREQLHSVYDAYLYTTQGPQVGKSRLSETITQLAGLCETLGWKRDADAWRLVLKRL